MVFVFGDAREEDAAPGICDAMFEEVGLRWEDRLIFRTTGHMLERSWNDDVINGREKDT